MLHEKADLLLQPWAPVRVPDNIPHGDMPGDKVQITQSHIDKAAVIFPRLQHLLHPLLKRHPNCRGVISVCGGSGVGKSEIASVLSYYLHQLGIQAYILSGDNYPRRIPRDNDLERLRIYRVGGLKGLIYSGLYTSNVAEDLKSMWETGLDASPVAIENNHFMEVYQKAGQDALTRYLGTDLEIDFAEINDIIARFKQGSPFLFLKRMGREPSELWYDQVDFREISVLIIEWTHGNSDWLQGVDIPILLDSTPAETLAHRKARSRDGGVDSPFTTTVLEIEQKKLESQASKAKMILSKGGRLLSQSEYLAQRLTPEEEDK